MDNPAITRSDFANRLYSKLTGTHAGENMFFSPFSIEIALAIAAVGARGETRQEMIELIGAPESIDEQNQLYARLLNSVYGDSKQPFELIVANAFWGQRGYSFNPAFQEAIAEFYDAALHVVDFHAQPADAVKAINSWVNEKTRGKIRDVINRSFINNDTRLIITNAVYFKGTWVKVFERDSTTDEIWHGPTTSTVQMMHQKAGYLHYDGDGFQAVNLPYRGHQFSMLIVLPRKYDGLAALEQRWTTQQLFRQVTDGLDPETVILSVPRFKIEAGFTLRPVLCALHADAAFRDDADFSGISNEPSKISEVVHKAFVEVNEEGTEAGAATAVGMMAGGLGSRPPEPIVFKADHPFLLFIWDRKTNAIYFSGRLVNPN